MLEFDVFFYGGFFYMEGRYFWFSGIFCGCLRFFFGRRGVVCIGSCVVVFVVVRMVGLE